jgi:hypothetical protein
MRHPLTLLSVAYEHQLRYLREAFILTNGGLSSGINSGKSKLQDVQGVYCGGSWSMKHVTRYCCSLPYLVNIRNTLLTLVIFARLYSGSFGNACDSISRIVL